MYHMNNGYMMHNMGFGGSLMFGLFYILIFIVLILAILALIKYLRS